MPEADLGYAHEQSGSMQTDRARSPVSFLLVVSLGMRSFCIWNPSCRIGPEVDNAMMNPSRNHQVLNASRVG